MSEYPLSKMANPGTVLVRCMHNSYEKPANTEVQSPFYYNLYVLSLQSWQRQKTKAENPKNSK